MTMPFAIRFGPPLVALLACSRDKGRSSIVQLYESDPNAAVEYLTSIQDPIEREATAIQLVEAYPGKTASICDSLGSEASVSRCVRFNERPHLWGGIDRKKQGPVRKDDARPGGGPSTGRLLLPPAAAKTWRWVRADAGPCDSDDPLFSTCLGQKAIEAARQGRILTAGKLCEAMGDEALTDDCFFVAAEAVPTEPLAWVPEAGPDDLPADSPIALANALCLGAGQFAPECLNHIVSRNVRAAVETGEAPPQTYERVHRLAADLAAFWQARDPDTAPLAVDQFWGRAAWDLLIQGRSWISNGFDYLPAEAAPHLRSAIGVIVADESKPLPKAIFLSLFRPPLQRKERVEARAVLDRKDYWTEDLPGEESIPAIYYLAPGTGRRPADPDPEIDLTLSLLTAAAYQSPPRIPLIGEHISHEQAVVRWTATRLLAELDPSSPLLDKVRNDPDARVRGRVP